MTFPSLKKYLLCCTKESSLCQPEGPGVSLSLDPIARTLACPVPGPIRRIIDASGENGGFSYGSESNDSIGTTEAVPALDTTGDKRFDGKESKNGRGIPELALLSGDIELTPKDFGTFDVSRNGSCRR